MDSHTHRSPRTIVVVGMGRLGRLLAGRYSEAGHAVVAVDRHPAQLETFPVGYSGFAVEGDARELDVLRRARVESADVLIATTDDDNLNIMLALIARQWFDIAHAIARISDSPRERVAATLGIEVINPNQLAVEDCLTRLITQGGA